ncbi:MAG: PRC-barrel domain-containing protein [Candidatus Howiella sp.]|jgi:YlmC/YmxH family sporulation protein
MCCRIEDLRDKQVVSIKSGCVIGYICDVEVDTCNGKLVSIVIFGRRRCFGLLGREEDIVIPWCDIEVIGADTVLVGCELPPRPGKRGFFGNAFRSSPNGKY